MTRSVALLGISILAAQEGLRVETPSEPLPKTPPASEALQASVSPIDPDEAYRELISGDSERSKRAAKALGVEILTEPAPEFVRSIATNLDAGPELERVLYVESLRRGIALIFARREGVWWLIGEFICGMPSGLCPGEFVEPKQTVWLGTNDLVLHSNVVRGTNVSQDKFTIYRVFSGRLYPVFDIVESAYDMRGSESSRVRIHDPGQSSEAGTLVVDRTKRAGGKRTTECLTYKWNFEKFAFLPIPPTRALCAPAN